MLNIEKMLIPLYSLQVYKLVKLTVLDEEETWEIAALFKFISLG